MTMQHAFAAAAAAVLLVASPAEAVCLTCSCEVTPDPMTFGSFSPLAASTVDAVAAVRVNCTGAGVLNDYTIRMNAGLNGTLAQRRMSNGASTLSYNIFKDAARTTIWGDDTGGYTGVTVVNLLGLLVWNSSTNAYGRIPVSTTTTPGPYADTVTVTVTW